MEPDKIAEALRKWAATQDNSDKAAVELLAWHEFWLRRPDFRAAAIRVVDRYTVIRWREAREFAESGPRCSTSEEMVLRLAIAIALDDFRLAQFGSQHRRAVVRAFATAVGLEVAFKGD